MSNTQYAVISIEPSTSDPGILVADQSGAILPVVYGPVPRFEEAKQHSQSATRTVVPVATDGGDESVEDTEGWLELSELSDVQLYEEYQEAKQDGPVGRIDEVQLEIARRWESWVKALLNDT
jgi:hypothetical protein